MFDQGSINRLSMVNMRVTSGNFRLRNALKLFEECILPIFFFFLEIEKLTPYPRSSYPPITVFT